MIEPAFFLAGGLARLYDGTGKPYGVPVMAVAAIGAAWWGVQPTDVVSWGLVLLCAVGATVALQRGFSDWTSFQNAWQYWPAILPVPVLLAAYAATPQWSLAYALCLLLAGLAHPVLAWVNERYPFHYTRYAEWVAGACVIGPLSLV